MDILLGSLLVGFGLSCFYAYRERKKILNGSQIKSEVVQKEQPKSKGKVTPSYI